MLSLKAEGFSCTLGVLYGGLGIGKLQILIKKIEIKFPAINVFLVLGHHTLDADPESGTGIRFRNPDPQLEINADPKPWIHGFYAKIF
jgi:hypothetical protein